ncbi:hypothetical protein RclHR1_06180018 [Rhizophagus clarus]|uniref:Transmembrane protein n=1 Tax=Rhizophagus clarus TaxID=94130 RepID=A0A2Z6RWU0_9GLOM|nr:hypothetical protein RclHR1_06180018 [Rhizophagus clarus]
MKKSRFNSIFIKRPTKCCCCIPFQPGTTILCILLFINGIWNASLFLSEIAAYSRHTAREVAVLLGLLYFLVIPVSIFGIYVTRREDEKLLKWFSILYRISLSLLLILHLIDLILFFVWKSDVINACQNDLSYLVPSNSSTVQVAFDPNAPTKKQVDDACVQAVNLSLSLNLFDFIILKMILYFYFGAVVSAYSKSFAQISTDGKEITNSNKEKNGKISFEKQESSLDGMKGSIKSNDNIKLVGTSRTNYSI